MGKIISPAQFNQKVEFGTDKSVLDENTGVNYQEFIVQIKCHAKHCRLSFFLLSQTYQAQQAGMLDTITIIIRHNAKVNDSIKCKMAGIIYDIVSVSSDTSLAVNRYDTLTIRKNKKVK